MPAPYDDNPEEENHSREDEAGEVAREIEAGGGRSAMLQLVTGDSSTFDAFALSVSPARRETFNRADLDVRTASGDSRSTSAPRSAMDPATTGRTSRRSTWPAGPVERTWSSTSSQPVIGSSPSLHLAAGLTGLPEEVHMAPGMLPLLPIGEDDGSRHGQGGRASWRNFAYSLPAADER